MLQALDQDLRQVAQILGLALQIIVGQHGDNLIVGFILIDHLQPTHHPRGENNLRAVNRPFTDHTDIKRVAIPACCSFRQRADPPPTIGTGLSPVPIVGGIEVLRWGRSTRR